MHLHYFFGTAVLLCLTYQCIAAEVSKTKTNTGAGSTVESANQQPNEGTKPPVDSAQIGKNPNGSQKAKQQDPQTSKSSSDKKIEPIQSNPKPADTLENAGNEPEKIRTSSVSSDADKQPRSLEEPKPVVSNGAVTEELIGADRFIKPARILVMLPLPFYSHTQNYMPIFKELAKRGHHVTVVSPYPQNVTLPNWEEILVENVLPKLMASLPDKDFSKRDGFISKIIGFMFFGEFSNRLALEMKPVQNLYNDDTREFDLVFVEAQFVQEPLLAFGHKFKAPVITLYPTYIVPEVAYYTGNPVLTSTYVPHMMFPFSNSMNFLERATNTAFILIKLLSYNLLALPKMDALMREYLPSKDLPYVGDLLFNVSFTLMDSHHILNYPYPRANNIREFLGINTKPTSALSPELQEYMDGAEDGVVFFTLGSHYQTSTLRPHILKSLVAAFSKLPNKVLMKWDKDEPPAGLSSNVKTGKWFPQSAILAHKNCKVFVTHTGVHGLVESLDHAVPVVSVPLFADQHFFAKWVVEKGVGLAIDIETVTPEIAYDTINEVITNKKYSDKVKEYASLMRDLPLPTLSEITYWVEYVIRTKGAPLLRPGSLNLAWYQRFGLDLLAAAVVITVVPLWLVCSLLKCLFSMCRSSKKSGKNSSAGEKSKKSKKTD